ncbi:MAG: hypothetical protein ABSE69_20735 [Roseiarcus sp.]|jgi:hypothetical protein
MVAGKQPPSGKNTDLEKAPSAKDQKYGPVSNIVFESFITKYNAAQEANNGYQTKSLNWSVRTFIAVSIYTAVTLALFFLSMCTLQTQKDTFYFSQRASVILSDIDIVPTSWLGTNIGYTLIPRWQNAGGTNADKMSFFINYDFSRDDLPRGFSNVESPKEEGPTSVGPKETLGSGAVRDKIGRPIIFPQACLDEMTRGKFRFNYIWGTAIYNDILRPDIARTTKFCWRLYGTLSLRGDIKFNHYLCDEGNCQDDACKAAEKFTAPTLPIDTCAIQIPIMTVPPEPPVQPAIPNTGQTPK